MKWLREVAAEVDQRGEFARVEVASQARAKTDAQRLARELVELEKQLAELTRQFLRRVIPESAYVTVRDELEARRTGLEQQRLEVSVHARRPQAAKIARELLADWSVLPIEARRGALQQIIGRIEVTSPIPGMSPLERVRIAPIWEGIRHQ